MLFLLIADTYDTGEWARAHYGPSDAERDLYASWEQSRRHGGSGGSFNSEPLGFKDKRAGSFTAADYVRMNSQSFSRVAATEKQEYRAFAQRFRAARAASDKQLPMVIGALGVSLLFVYMLARKFEEHRTR